jgi:hypothetical protein
MEDDKSLFPNICLELEMVSSIWSPTGLNKPQNNQTIAISFHTAYLLWILETLRLS